jgi:nucleoside-diphosphate-sugar epimerase
MIKDNILVLVTGASGFIGHHLCHYLLESGFSVRATYRGEMIGSSDNNIEWINVGEIGPDTHWEEALKDVDYVIHLAALAHQIGDDGKNRLTEFMSVNTYGTKRLISQAVKFITIKRIVFISSVSVYDQCVYDKVDEFTICNPDTDYGRSKYEAELLLLETLKTHRVDWCILRPALVYGLGNPGNMGRLQNLINTGIPLPLANINNSRSFLFVGNLVDAIMACMTNPMASRKIFLVSDGVDLSTSELLRIIGKGMGKKVLMFSLPISVLGFLGYVGDKIKIVLKISLGIDTYSVNRLVGSFVVDSSYIRKTLGWIPPYSVEEGLRMTIIS